MAIAVTVILLTQKIASQYPTTRCSHSSSESPFLYSIFLLLLRGYCHFHFANYCLLYALLSPYLLVALVEALELVLS